MNHYSHQFRIYYEDTDAGGVVYHANYLNFFERARTEWLRSKGLNQSDMRDEANVILAIRKMDIEYLKPARLDDLITVTVEVVHHTRLIIEMHQKISTDSDLLATAQVKIVSLNAEKFKPMRFPTHYLEELKL